MKQGFTTTIVLEHLKPDQIVSYEAKEAYCFRYNCNEIPQKCFNGKYAILREILVYVDKDGRRHSTRTGTMTDGLSLGLTRIFMGSPMKSKYLACGVTHDGICQRARDIPDKTQRKSLRLSADRLFFEMVEYIQSLEKEPPRRFLKRLRKATRKGAEKLKAKAFFHGVRLGAGWEELRR